MTTVASEISKIRHMRRKVHPEAPTGMMERAPALEGLQIHISEYLWPKKNNENTLKGRSMPVLRPVLRESNKYLAGMEVKYTPLCVLAGSLSFSLN